MNSKRIFHDPIHREIIIDTQKPEELMIRMRHFQGPDLSSTLDAISQVGEEVMPVYAK